jgi:hypothetical protein
VRYGRRPVRIAAVNVVDGLAFTIWPIIIAAACAIRRKPHPLIAAAAMIVGLLLVLFLIYSFYRTAAGVANGYILVAMLGLLLISLRSYSDWTIRIVLRRAIGATVLIYGCWLLAGDFLLRTQVEGAVERVEKGRGNRAIDDWRYHIEIGGRSFVTTKHVLESVEAGQRIRAGVGRASGMVLAVERLPS